MLTADILSDALALCLEISEVDPGQKSFRLGGGAGLNDYDVVTMHRLIKEALELDDSNITGALLLDALSSMYLAERTFSIQQLLDNPEHTAMYVQRCARFQALVRNPVLVDQNRPGIGGTGRRPGRGLAGCAAALESGARDHQGNHLLERIDPMAWALRDPWCQVDFRVRLFLSKRGLAQIQKRFPASVAAGQVDAEARAAVGGSTRFVIG